MQNIFNSLLNDADFIKTDVYKNLVKSPLGFVDIGARGGVFEKVESIAGITAVMGFEPEKDECQRLSSEHDKSSPWAKSVFKPVGLAGEVGKTYLHLLDVPTNDSLRYPNEDFTRRYDMTKFEWKDKVLIETTTLDKVIFDNTNDDTRWGEFLKLDTQGTEFEILESSIRTLKERTVAIYVEIEFCELYREQKLFSDIEKLLRSQGFSFYGFDVLRYRSRKTLDKYKQIGRERLIGGDAIFFKDPLPGGPCNQNLSDRENQIIFLLAFLFEFYDYAIEIAEKTWAKEGSELQRIANLVHRYANRDADETKKEIVKLSENIKNNPDHSNVVVGKFVDERRKWFDYSDIILD